MTAVGENIVRSLTQLRTFCLEAALLLKTADEIMKDSGWTLRTNQCVSLSTVPDGASYWFPHEAFRFYKKDGLQRLLPFVSVVLFSDDVAATVDEPLVSAGWHEFGPDVTAWPDFQMDYAGWHPYMPGRRDDGQFVSVDPRREWPKENYRMVRTTTMGFPLVAITNAEQLKKRVTEPLLSALDVVQR